MSGSADSFRPALGVAALMFLFSLFQAGCYRAYPPPRPDSVPIDAVWAGGLDGGGWVRCSTPSSEFNICTIYDEEGRTPGPARYSLRDAGRAARLEELKYRYVTGEAIGLDRGLELSIIKDKR